MKRLNHLRLSNNEKFGLISNFTTMFTAGIPILECVDSLLEGSKGNIKIMLQTMRADLSEGKHLYFSLAKFPLVFDIVTVNIIKAAEEAGSLDVALKDLKAYIQKETEFSDRLKSAMIYPLFIVGVFIAVLLMILVVVVPKIATVFSRLNVELPLPTRMLIFMSDTLLTYTPFVLIGAVIVIAVSMYLFRQYKSTIVNVLFSLPLLSNLAREIDLTKFTHSMYLLLNAGIPIINALELSVKIVVKKNVAAAINHAREAVQGGKKLSEGLKSDDHVIPLIMVKITEAGERSGSLDKSMQDISEYMDYQVSGSLKTLIALVEPIMLVLVGVAVGGMMLAIIAPIYGLIGSVGAR